ncbi:MAG: carbohydrate kinase [Spartobacteria bacterium]|nr:carbohydrate kinase [Spartobacteria bacterium]
MKRYFMGLDSSTQSLSVLVIDGIEKKVVYTHSINFDTDLPAYKTQHGSLEFAEAGEKVVHAPPLMWLEALDLLLSHMEKDGFDFSAVCSISGSGQQHGSVYLNASYDDALAGMNDQTDLKTAFAHVFSRDTAPIWRDSSTSAECAEITDALGGPDAVAQLTGSSAFERFTGPQIRAFYKRFPAAYAETKHIALVSSFLPSILAGKITPIDFGDGAGMNLMDIQNRIWAPDALAATAPDLICKLPPLAPSDAIPYTIAPYFVQKYGFSESTAINVWSGDNPCSLIGLGLTSPGIFAISLGTSDTCFGVMGDCRVSSSGEGHVFVSPTGDYMSLICYKNGSIARERIRDAYDLDWKTFTEAMLDTPAGNKNGMMLPWFEPEIVPHVLDAGVRRKNLDESDAKANVRACVEAQMMSMRIHSEWMGVRPSSIYATGGASVDMAILQIMADVNNCSVYRQSITSSATLGAALRAWFAWQKANRDPLPWEAVCGPFCKPDPATQICPKPENVAMYDRLVELYRAFEKDALSI